MSDVEAAPTGERSSRDRERVRSQLQSTMRVKFGVTRPSNGRLKQSYNG
jgi:hypothetical protein